jgi:hypothetical protein
MPLARSDHEKAILETFKEDRKWEIFQQIAELELHLTLNSAEVVARDIYAEDDQPQGL